MSLSFEEMRKDRLCFEDEVYDLTKKITTLQEQVSALNEIQTTNDNRYSKVKQENASLLAKVHVLEEQLRDIELQNEERKLDEQKRLKDAMARHEREKSFECEQYISRMYNLQQELLEFKDDLRKQQCLVEKLREEKFELSQQLSQKVDEIDSLREEVNYLKQQTRRHQDEESANSIVIDVLHQELDELRKVQSKQGDKNGSTPITNVRELQIYCEMEQEIRKLREENRGFREANEELQAQILNNHLQEGRSLIKAGEAVSSLANELNNFTVDQLRSALKEQQECNAKLRAYIDGILLNIVENYPQLLEVKSK
ncbi:rab11 family-interacting protein 4A-like protein [Leptotrombidium deliense]|uniref:Rab11 family-interacting protein 4A-like protein n=1 Tax=Leptotrombidium deliense TaxID=299467 RepID=A0A443SAC6_9ACAR|nr:rab11 family-interacting protein 4A-like protein [Leptotrombidium deliense]